MIRNVGTVDKAIRLVLGIALIAWVLFGMGVGSMVSYVAIAVGVILIGTGVMNFCPAFKLLGVSSFRK